MPRPTKCRRICRYPQTLEFQPAEQAASGQPVILTVDEYETIRLIDREGLSQEQCGESMQIARATVQKIYESARKKLADMLVNGLPLRIEGGDVSLCDGRAPLCQTSECYRQQIKQQYEKPKGDTIMRIAVTYENGQIFQHFGHTAQFKLYEIENNQVLSSEVVSTNGSGHGALAEILRAQKVDILICGGIGGGAQMALAQAGIKLLGGVQGEADAAVNALLAGNLNYNPNVQCNHHGEHHHHEGSCGAHGCGSHSCGQH